MDLNCPTLLAGEWVGPEGGEWFDDLDPTDTRDVVARLPRLSPSQVESAIDAADAASKGWAATSPIDRGRILLEASRLLRKRLDEIASDICREAGKLLREARGEVAKSADFLEYYAGLGRAEQGSIFPDERRRTLTYSIQEPLGVVVAITAWNDPLLTPARKIGPALITGNAVVLKPAEDTPLAALHLAHALVDGGMPKGVLSVVVGHPSDVAEPMLNHSAIRAVSFTGSTITGAALKVRLADRNIPFQAEMGGKNAAVVLDNANLDLASETIATAAFAQAGQRCTATSRVIAASSIREDLAERLVSLAASIRVGAGKDDSSEMGPLISQRHLHSVTSSLEKSAGEGDVLLEGGQRPDGDNLSHGCFLRPTVVSVHSVDGSLWREEVFGPVVALSEASNVEDAIKAVNRSHYGLSASVFTRDLESAMRFVAAVDTGQVAVNRPTSGWDVHLPFGGFKSSGSLSKEQGTEGLTFYTKVKTVAIGFEG